MFILSTADSLQHVRSVGKLYSHLHKLLRVSIYPSVTVPLNCCTVYGYNDLLVDYIETVTLSQKPLPLFTHSIDCRLNKSITPHSIDQSLLYYSMESALSTTNQPYSQSVKFRPLLSRLTCFVMLPLPPSISPSPSLSPSLPLSLSLSPSISLSPSLSPCPPGTRRHINIPLLSGVLLRGLCLGRECSHVATERDSSRERREAVETGARPSLGHVQPLAR